ncbi:MAG: MFS transporter [Pseudomonadota bacterium]
MTRRAVKPRHPQLVLLATILASSLAFIDGSVVNVALPAIGRDLGAEPADLQWTVNAYLLPLSALLLLGGAAGDHFGRRRLLLGGIALFAVASVACALAPSQPVLLAARVVQGVGAAMLMPNSLSILGTSFSGEAKGRAIGTWAAAGAIAGAAGPPLGGWLVEAIGWRAIFFVNLPVAAAALTIARLSVPESAEGKQPLDWRGAALATLALGALTWALTRWSSSRSFDLAGAAGAGAGIALLVAFGWVEHRRGSRAMMPTALFGTRAFVGLTLYTFLLYGALGGLILLVPYVLIESGGYDPFHAGLALLPFAVGIGLGSRLAGQVTERIGPRWPLTVGPGIVAIGFALLTRLDPHASYWTTAFPGLATIAGGMAIAVAPLTTAVLSSVDDRHAGTASGFNSAIARTGGLIATALAGAVIAAGAGGLVAAFHAAAWVGAALALCASASAFATLAAKR